MCVGCVPSLKPAQETPAFHVGLLPVGSALSQVLTSRHGSETKLWVEVTQTIKARALRILRTFKPDESNQWLLVSQVVAPPI